MLSVMRRTAVLALTAVAVGCSLPDLEPMPGEAPPSTVATPLATPWKSTSQRIEILTSELNSARSPIYVKDRARLSEEQLAALAQMRFVTPSRAPGIDQGYFLVRITDADGSVATYGSSDRDPRSYYLDKSGRIDGEIAFETFRGLAKAARCTLWSDAWLLRSSTTAAPPNDAVLSVATPLVLDEGCRHYVGFSHRCIDNFYTLEVTARATYEISLDTCVGDLSLRIYQDARTSQEHTRDILAEGAPGAHGECKVVRHTLEPGSYVVAIGKTNPSGYCPLGDEEVAYEDPRLKRGLTALRVRPIP